MYSGWSASDPRRKLPQGYKGKDFLSWGPLLCVSHVLSWGSLLHVHERRRTKEGARERGSDREREIGRVWSETKTPWGGYMYIYIYIYTICIYIYIERESLVFLRCVGAFVWQTDRQTDRQTEGQTNRPTDRQTDRWIDRQTDIQIDRQTERETDRQKDAFFWGAFVWERDQRKREREKEKKKSRARDFSRARFLSLYLSHQWCETKTPPGVERDTKNPQVCWCMCLADRQTHG